MKLSIKIFIAIATIALLSFSENNASEKNIQLITDFYNHFNNHEWEKMASFYAEKAQFLDPSFGEKSVLQTHDQIIKKYAELSTAFPNLHDQVVKMYASGENIVVVEFVSTGSSQDGMEFSIPICTIFEIKNGKILKDHTYYDNF